HRALRGSETYGCQDRKGRDDGFQPIATHEITRANFGTVLRGSPLPRAPNEKRRPQAPPFPLSLGLGVQNSSK
ncbi:MAG TPA: hypothetical protein VGF02_01840, partial [Pseudolabrys sp.]